MRSHGFIFSLDAFVAFTLIMTTVGLLIFTIGIPQSFFPQLSQAHQLAYDTLFVLASGTDQPYVPEHRTYLEQILQGGTDRSLLLRQVAGGDPAYHGTIPRGYGYRLEVREFSPSGPSSWQPLYDSAADPYSDRFNRNFSKLAASATTFLPVYLVQPRQGESQYCYLSCYGYQPDGNYSPSCNATPCEPPTPNFQSGQNSVQMVRLTVYT